MNLSDAQDLAIDLMHQHGLREPENFGSTGSHPFWIFRWIRSKNVFGRCSYGPVFAISLSCALVSLNPEADVRDTILHEIAHALVGPGHNHDIMWRIKAAEIGARPERCYQRSAITTPPSRWLGRCPGCGVTIHRHKLKASLLIHATHTQCKRMGKECKIEWRLNTEGL